MATRTKEELIQAQKNAQERAWQAGADALHLLLHDLMQGDTAPRGRRGGLRRGHGPQAHAGLADRAGGPRLRRSPLLGVAVIAAGTWAAQVQERLAADQRALGSDIERFLRSHLPPRPPPVAPSEAVERMLTGCSCGNPVVSRDTPCRFCETDPVPTRDRPARCPRCGVVPAVDVMRDLDSAKILVRCHGATETATVPLGDLLEADEIRPRFAERLAAAIARLR